MIITRDNVGAHGGKVYYTLRNSIADTGESSPAEVARFTTLEEAATVLRYMSGGSMSEADAIRAREAIKAAAPTG